MDCPFHQLRGVTYSAPCPQIQDNGRQDHGTVWCGRIPDQSE